jgi:uncharacterized repeat protein (TIGR01451 family)
MLRVILSPLHEVPFRCDGRHAVLLFLSAILLLPMAAGAQSKPAEPEPQAQIDSKQDSHPNTLELQDDSQTQAPLAHGPIHIVPYGPPATPLKKSGQPIGELSNNGTVQYWGGPVMSNAQVIEVLWGNFVDASSTTGLEQFFTDITQSNYFGLLAEYSTIGLSGFGGAPGTNQIIGPGTFLNPRITIAPALCPGSATNTPCTITDQQIQSEIANQLNAHHLPTPVQDAQGNFNTIYMIYFPPGVTITLGTGVSCQKGGFCAYHSNLASKLPYAIFPDFSQGGCAPAKGCGNGTAFQNLTAASSHELAEAVTDAEAGNFNGSAPAPPLAWVDKNTGQEIGDFCNHDEQQITVNSNTYTVQQLWSNMQNGCVAAPAHFQISMPTTVIPGRPFNMTVIAQNSIGNVELNNYTDTVHFTTSDTNSPVIPADYTFVPGDSGVHTFSVTLNAVGPQTVSAIDTSIPAMTGVGTIDVEHNPDLVVASAHSPASFKQGDTGDTYTVTVTNIGDKATNGSTVTVVDGLSPGLTATAVGGTGWTCSTPPILSCTRSDALAAGASYPVITVTVNVSFTAQSRETNVVQVSGGGEANTANDTTTDQTVVVQFPDLTVFMIHPGVFSQGQIGESYQITVINSGFVTTTGTVTMTDTLPAGLTATAISGPGWTCTTPPTLTCTRADPLPPFSMAYPNIKMTVNVDPNAPMPTVTNVATVSGGGEVNLGNDTANDVTTITPPAADLIVASAHSGTFTQGQSGSYSFTASNIGPAATTGTVTVTDNLPSGLTATSMSGTGWTCNTSTVTCTRSDALPGNTGGTVSSYPPITLSVSVSTGAPLTVINVVTVSGGGEQNTVNDSAADLTTIIGLADLALFSNHLGDFVAGQSGVYSLIVNNFGQGPSTGTVTVVETLPSGFTATAMTGPGWSCTLSTVTCTRGDSVSPAGTFPAISVTVSLASTLNEGIVTNMANVSGGGEINTSNDTAFDQTEVLVPLSFPGATTSVTVVAGHSATYGILVSAGATGSITFGCSGLPAGAACQFGVNPLIVNTPALLIVNLIVTTTAPSASRVSRTTAKSETPLPFHSGVLFLVGIGGIIMAGRCRKGGSLHRAARFGGLAILLLVMGCGGGGGGTPPVPKVPVSTPGGNYSITVTATNGSLQASKTVFLVVQ